VFQAEACAESDVNQLMFESDGGGLNRDAPFIDAGIEKRHVKCNVVASNDPPSQRPEV
jgi:hypothetical protein